MPEPIPSFLSHLTVYNGLPVPFFTAVQGGVPNFRAHSPKRHSEAIRGKLCGVCGKRLGYWQVLIVGPKELAGRTTYMPAMHEECARYALSVCPFLALEERVMHAARVGQEVPVTDNVLPKPTSVAIVRTSNYRIVYGGQKTAGCEYVRFAPPKAVEWLHYVDGKLVPRGSLQEAP